MMWPERAKTGAVRLALRTGAPIVPVAMVGAHRVVGRHELLPTLVLNLVRRPKVNTRVGAPIDIRRIDEHRPDDRNRPTTRYASPPIW